MTNATVGISDMKILKNEGTLITYALGSCIGICVYDETNKLGGMVHIMLPRSLRKPGDNIYKYAERYDVSDTRWTYGGAIAESDIYQRTA